MTRRKGEEQSPFSELAQVRFHTKQREAIEEIKEDFQTDTATIVRFGVYLLWQWSATPAGRKRIREALSYTEKLDKELSAMNRAASVRLSA